MRIDILTLFPASIDAMMNVSILGRAQERGCITIKTHQIREYTTNKQMQVDDYPYGGGRGAVMQADPLYRCWDLQLMHEAFLQYLQFPYFLQHLFLMPHLILICYLGMHHFLQHL